MNEGIPEPGTRDDLALALRVIDAGVGALEGRPGVRPFGAYTTFSPREHAQLEAVREQIVGYLRRPKPRRPLCIAVFGPPGSGKSFAVEEIQKAVARDPAVAELGVTMPLTTLNLTQVDDTVALGEALQLVAARQAADDVPFVFFDEFDTPRDGAPWGWLNWFLAPMHDGAFLHRGARVPIARAVFFFAGGTADTLLAFSRPREEAAFRTAKGPDFVSRLRGFVDVAGPNAEPRALRRAVVVRGELARIARAAGYPELRLDAELAGALLRVGRFRHGARSVGAVLEGSALPPPDAPVLTLRNLPPPHLLSLHADRGPLDPGLVGGPVAMSGGGYAQAQARLEPAWRAAARALWAEGALLAYVGVWGASGLAEALAEESAELPKPLERAGTAVAPRVACFTPKLHGVEPPEPPPAEAGVQLVGTHGVMAEERARWSGPHADWLCDVVSLFRVRLQVTEACVARVSMGGKTAGYRGRFPSVAEEVMLALRLGRPVYLAGGFGGAAADVGHVLALGRPWTGPDLPAFRPYADPARQALVDEHRDLFRPPPWHDLPATLPELVGFLADHALGGPRWPDNGLNAEENRELFACADPARVATLVRTGLRRRFGDRWGMQVLDGA